MPVSLTTSGGVVVSAHSQASQAGIEVLRKGGNAIDAAVAVAFALGVVEPHNTGIGGYGGFALISHPDADEVMAVDFNTRAPRQIDLSLPVEQTGARSVSVPAVVAGLDTMLTKFGSLPLGDVLEPSIRLAVDGFMVGASLRMAFKTQNHIRDVCRVYRCDPSIVEIGDVLRNPSYGASLQSLAQHGPREFYEGQLAESLVSHVRTLGSDLTKLDLQSLKVGVTPAVYSSFSDWEIATPGPGSGGELVRSVTAKTWQNKDNILDQVRSPGAVVQRLNIMDECWRQVRPWHASHQPISKTGQHTTHLSVVDASLTAVAITLTHGPLWFGSGCVVPETGVVLNNGMALFSEKPHAPSSLRPGAAPVTNMSPTIIRRDQRPVYVVGTPGGPRIPNTVANFIIDTMMFGQNAEVAINLPRFHTEGDGQWHAESGLREGLQDFLKPSRRKVHELPLEAFYGPFCAIDLSQEGAGRRTGIGDKRFVGVPLVT